MKNRFSEIFLTKGVNYYAEDRPLNALLEYFGQPESEDLKGLGRYVSEELVELLDSIDHRAKPVLHTWGVLGNRIDYVRISPDHFSALIKLQDFGVIRSIFSGKRSLMQHFISGYVVSDSGIFCTLTLTAQTAYAVEKYADTIVKAEYFPRFLDSSEPWFGATFYTETQGGSDLGSNRTAARKEGDHYVLTGSDKYFASNAGIADASIVTARLEGSPKGAKGISVFLVPAYQKGGEQNYTIRRLKDKHGTIAVPTGEVEFNDSAGYILGDESNGIYIAMEILTISRIDDAIAAAGIARKALWEAVRYTEKREAFGKPLINHPLMLRDLVEMESELEAALAVSFLSASMFDSVSGLQPPYDERYQLARIMSNIAKNMAAETSAKITRYSMEILGGIGFLEEFPMAKFHRDSIVTSIWEGTSNIQALEFLEVIVKKDGKNLLLGEMESLIAKLPSGETREKLEESLLSLSAEIDFMLSSPEPQLYAKDCLTASGEVLGSVVLTLASEAGGVEAMRESARFYVESHITRTRPSYESIKVASAALDWMREHGHT